MYAQLYGGFGGVQFREVSSGTVIKDDRTGQEVTVDDNTAAFRGNVFYCTAKTVQALRRALSEQEGR